MMQCSTEGRKMVFVGDWWTEAGYAGEVLTMGPQHGTRLGRRLFLESRHEAGQGARAVT